MNKGVSRVLPPAGLLSAAVCAALGAMLLSPGVQAASYAIQGENIKASSDWTDMTGTGLLVDAASGPEADSAASMGQTLHILDEDVSSDSAWIRTTQAVGDFRSDPNETPGTATAVFRMKTAPASAPGFSETSYTRSVILSFAKDGSRTRRAIGFAIRPDKFAVVTTTSNLVTGPGAEVTGLDNTDYHIYTIVARDYGYLFDVYRDGVKLIDNAANNSASESAIGGSNGLDALSIGSSPRLAMGDYYLDWIGYGPGEHPEWTNTIVPEPTSLTVLALGLGGLLKLRSRRK